MGKSSNTVIGTFRTADNIPPELHGRRILYSSRQDIPPEKKFTAVDDDGRPIFRSDGLPFSFGFAEFKQFKEKNLIDISEVEREFIMGEFGLWKFEEAERIREEERRWNGEDEPKGGVSVSATDRPIELQKDPSDHLLAFFVTCFVITVVVCCIRVFGPTLVAMVQGMMSS